MQCTIDPRHDQQPANSDQLLRDRHGRILPCIANAVRLLSDDPVWRDVLWPANLGGRTIELGRSGWWWSRDDDLRLSVILSERTGIPFAARAVKNAVRLLAGRRPWIWGKWFLEEDPQFGDDCAGDRR